MTREESNKSLARQWFQEIWNDGRVEAIDSLAGRDAEGYLEGIGLADLDQFKKFHAALTGSFPHLRVDVEDVIAEADHVVLRWRLRGTHKGQGFEFPASGRSVDVPGMTWLTFQDGKLVKGQDAWNQGGFIQSLTAT